jgi:hypothetical protein
MKAGVEIQNKQNKTRQSPSQAVQILLEQKKHRQTNLAN